MTQRPPFLGKAAHQRTHFSNESRAQAITSLNKATQEDHTDAARFDYFGGSGGFGGFGGLGGFRWFRGLDWLSGFSEFRGGCSSASGCNGLNTLAYISPNKCM